MGNMKPCDLFEKKSGSSARWPSTGGIIGYAQAFRDLLRELDIVPRHMVRKWPGYDLGLLGQLYLTQRHTGFAIDRDAQFFRTVDEPLVQNEDGLWTSVGQHTRTPAVLHFSGDGGQCYSTMEAKAWYNRNR